LNQLNISHEDLRQAVEVQETTVLGLQHAAEDARKDIAAEKKQVEGESLFRLSFACRFGLFGIRSQFLFFIYGFQACGAP
jgi:hypothetical protein